MKIIKKHQSAMKKPLERAIKIIQKKGGIIRTANAIKAGIHSRSIYALCQLGDLEQISRGVYRLVASEELIKPDIITVAIRTPRAVLCLISALAFHEITTEIPHKVSIALPKGAVSPRIDHPPIEIYRFSNSAYIEGVEVHQFNGIPVSVYCLEKTLADCFKFRNKIGMDIVLESLKLYKTRNKFNHKMLLKYAKICRVEKIMRPYIEANL